MQLDTAFVYLLNNSGMTPAKLNQAAEHAALLDAISGNLGKGNPMIPIPDLDFLHTQTARQKNLAEAFDAVTQ